MPAGGFPLDVLTNVINVHWGDAAVEFSSGSLLYQSHTSIVDTGRISISMWIRAPRGFVQGTLFEFGATNEPFDRASYALVSEGSTGIDNIFTFFKGPIVFDTVFEANSSNDIFLNSNTLNLPFDVWHHVFIAVSYDYTSTLNIPGPWPFNIFVNGVDKAQYQPGTDADELLTPGYAWGNGSQTEAPLSGPTTGILVKGTEVAIPATTNNIPNDSDVWGGVLSAKKVHQLCDVQIWFGKYIDPHIHIGKFFKPLKTGDDVAKFAGRRVDSKVAEAAFGVPSIRFTGGADTFVNNTGLAGGFFRFLVDPSIDYIKSFSPSPPLA